MQPPNNATIAEWVNALAPDLRDRARGYLRDAAKEPLDSRKTWVEERALAGALQERIKALPSADAPIPLPVVAMVGVFVAVVSLRFGLFAFAAVVLMASALGLWSYAQGASRALAYDIGCAAVIDAAIPGVLPTVARTRHERAYVNAVMGLLTATGGYLSPELRLQQMEELAALLESGERLDTVCAEIAAGLSSESPESFRAEADALRARAERAIDPDTRAALEQSLALLSERSRRAESLGTLAERIEAESELVYQAFRSAQSSIAALRVSPTVAGLDTGGQTGSVADVAENIRRQTQAVENAVQELGIRS